MRRIFIMKLSAPKNVVFIISVVAFLIGLLGNLGVLGFLGGFSAYLVYGSFILLALGCLLKDL